MMLFRKYFLRQKDDIARDSGNAMIYVLVVVALFAALSFILARHTDTSETGEIAGQKLEIDASNLINKSAQIKQGIDQMVFGGTQIDDLDFTTPDVEPAFSTPPNIHKVFHPEGGGLVRTVLPDGNITQVTADPAPGWYVGRFNNIEWTESTQTDVVAVAFQINRSLCQQINKRLTGATTIPVSTVPLRNILINDALHTGANADFTTVECAACDGALSLCIEDPGNNLWAFYSVIEPR